MPRLSTLLVLFAPRRSAALLASALLLAACATAPHPPAGPGRFDQAIEAFETSDAAAQPAPCAVLFVGSSSIRFWRTLDRDFPDRRVINRGFGGSTIADVNQYFDRVVARYQPSAIVFYAGENDLFAGRAPADVEDDFRTFMSLKRRALGSTPVWYISAKPSKARFAQFAEQSDLNARIRKLADRRSDLAYIDIVPAMLRTDGLPKEIFVEDDLHMNADGYALWTPIVEAALREGQRSKAPRCPS
ncbi:hypothetical protein GC169_03660 [bacterium]|nr:hypothetical protein [bacterium]